MSSSTSRENYFFKTKTAFRGKLFSEINSDMTNGYLNTRNHKFQYESSRIIKFLRFRSNTNIQL